MEACPICHGPLGGRWGNRCYRCKGRPRSGKDVVCARCGETFYAPAWALNDTVRKQGTYCSRACKHAAITGREQVVGTSYIRKDGYRIVKVGIRQYRLEHRLVVERMLGRALGRREEVHHINGDKLDNRPENLVVVSPSEHQRLHPEFGQRMQRRVILTCGACGKSYARKASRATSAFCSNPCRLAALHEGNRKTPI